MGVASVLTPHLEQWCKVIAHLIQMGNWSSSHVTGLTLFFVVTSVLFSRFSVAAISDALVASFDLDTRAGWEGVSLAQRKQWAEVKKLFNEHHSAKLKIRYLCAFHFSSFLFVNSHSALFLV